MDASLSAERFRERAQDADLDLNLTIYQTGRRSRAITFVSIPTVRAHE